MVATTGRKVPRQTQQQQQQTAVLLWQPIATTLGSGNTRWKQRQVVHRTAARRSVAVGMRSWVALLRRTAAAVVVVVVATVLGASVAVAVDSDAVALQPAGAGAVEGPSWRLYPPEAERSVGWKKRQRWDCCDCASSPQLEEEEEEDRPCCWNRRRCQTCERNRHCHS